MYTYVTQKTAVEPFVFSCVLGTYYFLCVLDHWLTAASTTIITITISITTPTTTTTTTTTTTSRTNTNHQKDRYH